jgi:hypothetical protein
VFRKADLSATSGRGPDDPHDWWSSLQGRERVEGTVELQWLRKPNNWREEIMETLCQCPPSNRMPFPEAEYSYGIRIPKFCEGMYAKDGRSYHKLEIQTLAPIILVLAGLLKKELPDEPSSYSIETACEQLSKICCVQFDNGVLAGLWKLIQNLNFVSPLPADFPEDGNALELSIPAFLQKHYEVPLDRLGEHEGTYVARPDFVEREFRIKALRFAGLSVQWTRYFNQHLQIDLKDKILWLFWDSSVVGNPLHGFFRNTENSW